MARIWIFFTEKRALSYLLLGALIILGITSGLSIRRESAPEVQIPIAIISSALPGASPEDVELLIVREIEKAVENIDDVKKVTATAREGLGSVVVEFQASADLEQSIQKVKDEIDKIRSSLPDDATDPLVTEINFADQPILLASITSDLPVPDFRREAEELAEAIERIQGVSRVEIVGVRDREVSVIARTEALALHTVSLDDIVRAIQANNVTAPLGTLTVEGVSYPLSFEGRMYDPGQVGSTPIITRSGTVLTLNDLAYVGDGIERPTSISRISVSGDASTQAATLTVYKKRGADITRASADIQSLLQTRNSTSEIQTFITLDAGENIVKDLKQLTNTGMQTILLVLLVLFLALGWREALVAGISIPISFLTALTIMELSGNTINFISLFSLILAIGILVDTAIVMVEAIHTNMKAGLSRDDSVRQAIRTLHFPVTTGNLTTIAVFAPLFTISGVTGEFIASIPFTVIAVLVSSLIISLAFIPTLAARFLHKESSVTEDMQDSYAERFREWYGVYLTRLLISRRLKVTLAGTLIALLFTLVSFPFFGLIRVSFFPQSDVDYLYINVEEPQGTPLARTDITIRAVEEVLLDVPEIAFFTTTVGAGSAFDENPRSGARFASITINLTDASSRTRTSSEILADIESRLAVYKDLNYRVLQPSEGPPSGAPVLITFFGNDSDALAQLTNRASEILRTIPGTRAVSSSAEDSGNQLTVYVNRARSAEFGVNPAIVASALRTAVFGTEATVIKTEGEEVSVTVTLGLNSNWNTPEETTYVNPDALLEIPLTTAKGTVLLGDVVTVGVSASTETISREAGKRIETVSSQISEGFVAREISSAFREQFMEVVEMPDGVTMKLGGETEDVDQSFSDTFRALGLGILLIFAILVVQFTTFRQAFIVLATIPLSLIGVLLGLLLTREYLSFPSMLGFIALSGIVVNNAIILVDVWNRLREEHPDTPLLQVVVQGATMRLRPILLTTITTVVGIVPLVFASNLWRPIAVAIIFGLAFAVVLTLLFVPALYLKFCKRVEDSNEKSMSPTRDNVTLRGIGSAMLFILLLGGCFVPSSLYAYTYDNENIRYAYQEAPTSFSVDQNGEATGSTVSGMSFRQYSVTTDSSVRLQRFEIGNAHWYVSNKGVIFADNDLLALSVYLSRIG